MLQKFIPEDFLKTIQDYKIKTLNLVPPQVLMLVKSPLVAKYDISHVRQINVGAAPCSRELIEALLEKYPSVAFRQAYGMSEASPGTHIGLYNDMVHGSAGKILPNQEVRLVDPATGKDIAGPGSGERGEIWIRGPNVMKGYRNNEKATRETIDSEGWLHTGDVAIVDEKGNFFVVDRLKELIKYKGFQVAPAELEAILLTHPQILDAAVIGVENKEQATEVPLAFVVKNQTNSEGQSLTEQQVIDFVASKVAPHKKLRGGVRFIDIIPKSAAGKILRKDLRVLIQSQPKAKL
ncbi:putative fatty-acid--CoA ligase FadD10 [Linnemannia zychae]|nr:putative fatty-acid--CoA ligase FadD10 [Linnemannia zychae]